MHPYLTHRTNLFRYLPDARARRNRATDHIGGGILRRRLRLAVRQWQRNKMIAELYALDNRVLRDFGIYRGDIPRIVNGFDDVELGMRPLASLSDRTRKNDEVVHAM